MKISYFSSIVALNIALASSLIMADSNTSEPSLGCEPPPTTPTPQWTHCANEYGVGQPNSCNFSGLRRVRFGNGSQWVEKNEFNQYLASKCNRRNFPIADFDWTEGPFRCEYSSVIVKEPISPAENCDSRHDCNGFSMQMPAGANGASTEELGHGSEPTPSDHVGAFRTLCTFSHFAYNDPLVHPGIPGRSHLHAFFGNTSVNHDTDPYLLADSGDSTCSGGTLNRSAYWVPALLDMKEKRPLIPHKSIWYYKGGYQGLAKAGFDNLPKGLSMIGREYYWSCNDNPEIKHKSIPQCSAGSVVTLRVSFPQCWDGMNTWLPDESHVTNPVNRACPASHPKAIPRITLNIRYIVEYEGQIDNLMLASDMGNNAPGSTAHADWINGWNTDISAAFIENCLNSLNDCRANLIGNNESLR